MHGAPTVNEDKEREEQVKKQGAARSVGSDGEKAREGKKSQSLRSTEGELLALLEAAREGECQWERIADDFSALLEADREGEHQCERIVDDLMKREELQKEIFARKREEHEEWLDGLTMAALEGVKAECRVKLGTSLYLKIGNDHI